MLFTNIDLLDWLLVCHVCRVGALLPAPFVRVIGCSFLVLVLPCMAVYRLVLVPLSYVEIRRRFGKCDFFLLQFHGFYMYCLIFILTAKLQSVVRRGFWKWRDVKRSSDVSKEAMTSIPGFLSLVISIRLPETVKTKTSEKAVKRYSRWLFIEWCACLYRFVLSVVIRLIYVFVIPLFVLSLNWFVL